MDKGDVGEDNEDCMSGKDDTILDLVREALVQRIRPLHPTQLNLTQPRLTPTQPNKV